YIAYSKVETKGGGIRITGTTNSFGAGGIDMYILKIARDGSLLWSKTIGGTDVDGGKGIVRTLDDLYVAAGYTKSFGLVNYDFFVNGFDGNGNIKWSKAIGSGN